MQVNASMIKNIISRSLMEDFPDLESEVKSKIEKKIEYINKEIKVQAVSKATNESVSKVS